jgi:hypothetical protein
MPTTLLTPLAKGKVLRSNKDTARTWYDRGVAWMEKNKPKDEELQRFRTEAEELLK